VRELGAVAGTSGDGSRARAVVVPLVFIFMAGLLAANPWPFVSPVPIPPATPAWATNPAPIRDPSSKPEIQLAGYTYRCTDCHKLFPSPAETTRTLTWHREVVLQHGINDRCFNCHNRQNRDTFDDDWGREIPWDQPPRLCAKCHGPVYRDWSHGAHGRTNGYWDKSKGPQTRLKCVQCHDPHVPPFRPLQPAPPPDTLRMGNQAFPSEQAEVLNPLQIFRRLDSGESGTTAEPSQQPTSDVGTEENP
jgi:hypothetical protein